MSFVEIASIIWILIVSMLIIKDFALYNVLLSKKYESDNKVPEDLSFLLNKCKLKLNITKDIKIVLQDKIKTPSLYGICNTKILLTKEILNMSYEELECILLHELYHYKNKHHIIYIILQVIERIYFFNPFMQFALRKIRQDLEIITDELVLDTGIKFKDYSRTIIKSIEFLVSPKYPIPSICTEKREIERRILNMKNKTIDSKYAVAIVVLTIILISIVTISLASEKEVISNQDLNIIEKEEIVEQVEFILPLENPKVTAMFGERVHPITGAKKFHSGVDMISSSSEIVVAAADGIVTFADFDIEKGLNIKIEHADKSVSNYAHGSELYVKVGDKVSAGDKIMKVGKTGLATGPHLHFEVQNSLGEYVDINSLFNNL